MIKFFQWEQNKGADSQPDLQTAAEISKTAIDNSDQLAVEAVDLFLALIGAEAGHMGLRSLASGGIYICGGIMPKVQRHTFTDCQCTCILHEMTL